jgi:hypothetical protein
VKNHGSLLNKLLRQKRANGIWPEKANQEFEKFSDGWRNEPASLLQQPSVFILADVVKNSIKLYLL